MLKFILFTVALGISNFSNAQSSSISCVSDLMFIFRATATESKQICSINSSQVFLKCMDHKSLTTQLDVHSAAVQCDSKFKRTQKNPTNQYVNFNSCSSRLQVGARMRPRRSVEVCNWDSSELMMGCMIQIVQKAGWHSEHAIQYCGFANQNYRSQIPRFVNCVTTHPLRSKNVEQTAQACHDSILDIIIPLQKPRVTTTRPSDMSRDSVSVSESIPEEVVAEPAKPLEPKAPVEVVRAEEQNKKVVTETVPTPVKIQVQESAKAEEIVDQPSDANSTSNSEVLPID